MATDVVMPQMGESIAEGTIVRWIKKVGDTVERDEPLFEISTDKVDAEIPSPAAGVVSEIRAKEGETVPVNSVVAVIGRRPRRRRLHADAGGPPQAAPRGCRQPPAPTAAGASRTRRTAGRRHAEPRAAAAEAPAARPSRRTVTAAKTRRAAPQPAVDGRALDRRRAIRQRSSPLVRKIAKEHNVDISQIHGTGIAGRVTKDDILGVHRAGSAEARGEPGRPRQRRPAAGRRSGRRAGRASGAPAAAGAAVRAGAAPITSTRCR